jgi:hypothetical protein
VELYPGSGWERRMKPIDEMARPGFIPGRVTVTLMDDPCADPDLATGGTAQASRDYLPLERLCGDLAVKVDKRIWAEGGAGSSFFTMMSVALIFFPYSS